MDEFILIGGDLDTREIWVRKSSISSIDLTTNPNDCDWRVEAVVTVRVVGGFNYLLNFSDEDIATLYVRNLVNRLN